MKPIINIGGILLLTMFSNLVMAEIKLTTVAEVEVTETTPQGKKVVKRQPAKRIVPGSEVIYTITAKNTGNEPAETIVVSNPIPKQTVYIDGSAFGAGTDITFSVDDGKSYGKPEQLKVKDAKGKARAATAEDYTNVRWTFQFDLKPGEEAPVWYRVWVK